MLESQSRQNWLFGDSTYLFDHSYFWRNISFAHMSFQGIEVVNVDPHSVGIDILKLFLEGKLM